MTGSRFPGSRVVAFNHLPRIDRSQWYQWSRAHRLQLRGQLRHCLSKQTHRIPLASPCGHYQSSNWHRIISASTNFGFSGCSATTWRNRVALQNA